MKTLLTSDTHFDNKIRNEYRWNLFPWMKTICQEQSVSTVIICGDLFHNKDLHPSNLVNRFIDNLVDLLEVVDQILMLKCNHDLVEHMNPYLRWVNNIPKVRFFVEPETVVLDNKKFLFLPNSLDPISEWENYSTAIQEADYICAHQTFEGSESENGLKLSGISQSVFNNTRAKIYVGDIHKSQTLGKITYIGTPYPINFGDSSIFRTILLDTKTGNDKSLKFKTISKFTIDISSPEELADLSISPKDQIKVRLVMDDLVNWEGYKAQVQKYCKDHGIDLYKIEPIKKDVTVSLIEQKAKLKSMTPLQIFEDYCRATKVGEETASYGRQIIEKQE